MAARRIIEQDLADASLYWLAAETGPTEILTVDVSDFSRYRLSRGKVFTLLASPSKTHRRRAPQAPVGIGTTGS
jgi:hypothetical protein